MVKTAEATSRMGRQALSLLGKVFDTTEEEEMFLKERGLMKPDEKLQDIDLTKFGEKTFGVVEEALSAGWLIDINAPSPAFLHTEEVPWDVEFGATEKYLNSGDSIMAKVLKIDEIKKMQVTMKDRNLFKIKGGDIIDVEPSRVPRIIGKKGSMISLIKQYIRCRIFVGQNGKIWVDAEIENIERVIHVIRKIESEAITFGLTNRIEDLLKKELRNVQQ